MNAIWLGSQMNYGVSRLLLVTAALLASVVTIAAEAEKKSEESQEQLEQKLEVARKRLDAAAREVADLSMSMSEHAMPGMRHFVGMAPPRAMLGINLGSGRGDDSVEGVEVVSVSPGGAAADAGLKSGDVLVEVNGTALKRNGEDSPREKLRDAMRDVKPGNKVAVSYRRDGKVVKTTVIAQPAADRAFARALPMAGSFGVNAGPANMPHVAFMRAEGVFGSAELVPMTPKLGQYFGTDKGLLVVRAPNDSRLKLEDGDVIVDIDGRSPSSPSHALRILGSYQPGEKLKLNVLRAKKRVSFEITIPDDPWGEHIEGAINPWGKHVGGVSFTLHDDVMMPGVPALPATPMWMPFSPPPPNAIEVAPPGAIELELVSPEI